jgi:hypothetical protein
LKPRDMMDAADLFELLVARAGAVSALMGAE